MVYDISKRCSYLACKGGNLCVFVVFGDVGFGDLRLRRKREKENLPSHAY